MPLLNQIMELFMIKNWLLIKIKLAKNNIIFPNILLDNLKFDVQIIPILILLYIYKITKIGETGRYTMKILKNSIGTIIFYG